MYRSALRSSPRAAAALRQAAASPAARRFASTAPAKKRTWKGTAVRLGLVGGALYWYSTSPFFAEEMQPAHVAPPAQFSDDDLPTVEAVIEQKRKEAEDRVAKGKTLNEVEGAAATELAAPTEAAPTSGEQAADSQASVAGSSPEALEAEAGQQGAFNPETGEINWDCPCLGGMADGPCGEEFKAAFSCFVYSKEEPKGMDCIDKFQHMQDCFRLHPEVYGEELADDEEANAGEGALEGGAGAEKAAAKDAESGTIASSGTTPSTPSTPSPLASGAAASVEPAAAHDALAANSAEQTKPEPSEQKQEKADQ